MEVVEWLGGWGMDVWCLIELKWYRGGEGRGWIKSCGLSVDIASILDW